VPDLSRVANTILFIILGPFIPTDVTLDIDATGNAKAALRTGRLSELVWKNRGRPGKRRGEKEKTRDMKPLLPLLRTRGLPGKALQLARQMLSSFRVSQLDAEFRVGLDDPADTAIMYSVLLPALASLSSLGAMRFRIEPVFDEPTFEVSLRGKIRVRPLKTIGSILGFAVSPTGWRVMRSMVVSRWRKKS